MTDGTQSDIISKSKKNVSSVIHAKRFFCICVQRQRERNRKLRFPIADSLGDRITSGKNKIAKKGIEIFTV